MLQLNILYNVAPRLHMFICFGLQLYVAAVHIDLQGGSNRTGTNCDLFTHKSSRSYLNHLVSSARRCASYIVNCLLLAHDFFVEVIRRCKSRVVERKTDHLVWCVASHKWDLAVELVERGVKKVVTKCFCRAELFLRS
jgi:hypothetical protein